MQSSNPSNSNSNNLFSKDTNRQMSVNTAAENLFIFN